MLAAVKAELAHEVTTRCESCTVDALRHVVSFQASPQILQCINRQSPLPYSENLALNQAANLANGRRLKVEAIKVNSLKPECVRRGEIRLSRPALVCKLQLPTCNSGNCAFLASVTLEGEIL